jgi:hypothetical protein
MVESAALRSRLGDNEADRLRDAAQLAAVTGTR